MTDPCGWATAWQQAVYGPAGWARRGGGPASHFRTSAHIPLFAEAIATLTERVDEALGRPDLFQLVDIGAGRGELLAGVLPLLPPDLRGRARLIAVEVADRPAELAAEIDWVDEPLTSVVGLVVANEWLDDVALDCAVRTGDGLALVTVDQDGTERTGPSVADADAEWAARWWPVGDRVEIGRPRDEAWAMTVSRLAAGAALAIDYGHHAGHRPGHRTLTGFRDGREVPPVPDGSMNLTAHVAMDAIAAAGRAAGADGGWSASQRDAIDVLGVIAERPDPEWARSAPTDYLAALQRRGLLAELRDPAGLGGFEWLLQWRGVDPPLPG